MRRIFPSGVTGIKPTSLVWTGILTPTPLSRDYTVRITYSIGGLPRVVIVDPPLVPDENGLLPHFYREGSLCLHEAHEWNGSMLIGDSIIPWAAEWLAHYELWKWSGQWYGDGGPARAETATVPTPAVDSSAINRTTRPGPGRPEAVRAAMRASHLQFRAFVAGQSALVCGPTGDSLRFGILIGGSVDLPWRSPGRGFYHGERTSACISSHTLPAEYLPVG